MGEEVCGWKGALDGGELDCDSTTASVLATVGALYVFFSQDAEVACLVCLRNSAVNSWASLDLRPTLLKGLTETEAEEREEKLVLILSSVFSLRREPALWGPVDEGPFRGIVYRWVGGVAEAGNGACLSPDGLKLFFAFSSWTLRPEGSDGVVLLVKDCERFFLGLSSKNSMTKAWWGSDLQRLERDWNSGGEEDRGSSESGEAKRCGGEALRGCGVPWDPMWDSDWRKLFPLIAGSPESLWVPSWWLASNGKTTS